MCGICGIFEFEEGARPDRIALEEMTAFMTHRGPDGTGVVVDGPVGLGHRRLSIIDISGGSQPMSSPCGRYHLTFNGEIYNYIELRKELEARGRAFKTRSDTEVLLIALMEWGPLALSKLNGMFAFGFWDRENKTLFLARDRLGIKPLYYYRDKERLLFSSDLGSMAVHPLIKKEIDPLAISHFLSWRVVPVPYTGFKNTRHLPPGSYLLVNLEGQCREKIYWDPEVPKKAPKKSIKWVMTRLEELVHDAVRLRMRADVPVGAFLSGGVDSSAIVHYMKKTTPDGRPVTFTIGFRGEEKEFDESEFALAVAQTLGSEHYTHFLKPYEMEPLLTAACWYFNLPCGTGLPNFFVSQMARQHVKVALAGVGGDELFGGYTRFNFAHTTPDARQAEIAFVRSLQSVDHDLKRQMFTPEFFSQIQHEPSMDFILDQFSGIKTRETLNKLCLIDLRHYMLNDLLFNLDKMSMAHALEVRVPLLDHRLVEFALTVPPEYKIFHNIQKYALKRLVYNHLPAHVCIRRKRGFSLPKVIWIKRMKDFILNLINEESVKSRGIFDWPAMDQYVKNVMDAERVSWAQANNLWSIFNLELWFRQFLDTKPNLTPPEPGVMID